MKTKSEKLTEVDIQHLTDALSELDSLLKGTDDGIILWEKASKIANKAIKKINTKTQNCPYCGSKKVVYFDADNDMCNACEKWFPGE